MINYSEARIEEIKVSTKPKTFENLKLLKNQHNDQWSTLGVGGNSPPLIGPPSGTQGGEKPRQN